VVLGTFCGTNPTRVDTYANEATLIFRSDNNAQPNTGFIVRVNASVDGKYLKWVYSYDVTLFGRINQDFINQNYMMHDSVL
jgi:hypothetical protein